VRQGGAADASVVTAWRASRNLAGGDRQPQSFHDCEARAHRSVRAAFLTAPEDPLPNTGSPGTVVGSADSLLRCLAIDLFLASTVLSNLRVAHAG
jgi:hypothetical protein